jgi:nicotinamidase-related amidase
MAKRMGRQVTLRSDWEQVKEQVMYDCLVEKFKDEQLRNLLIATYPSELIEGNTWHDNCWGNCVCEKCKHINGRNLLGKTLMRVRKELMEMEQKRYEEKDTIKLLVVVDMQNDFVTGSLGTKEAQGIVGNVTKKVNTYVENGNFVVFTKDTHEENYMETPEGKKLPVPHCIRGTDGWEIIPELSAYNVPANHFEGGNTFEKTTFGSTHLAKYIENLDGNCIANGKTLEVEFVGLCTDICVVSNVLMAKAHCPNIKITVDANCCAGVTPDSHNSAIATMKMCQIDVING